jgi:ribosomal protein S21
MVKKRSKKKGISSNLKKNNFREVGWVKREANKIVKSKRIFKRFFPRMKNNKIKKMAIIGRE